MKKALLYSLCFMAFAGFSCSSFPKLTDLITPSRSLSSFPWEKVYVNIQAEQQGPQTFFSKGESFFVSPSSPRIPSVDENLTSKINSFLWANQYLVKSKENAKYHLYFEYDQKESKRQIAFNEAKNSYDIIRYDISLVMRVKSQDAWGQWQDVWVGNASTKLGKNSLDFVDELHNCWQVDYHLAALLRDFGQFYPDQIKWVYPQHFQELGYTKELTQNYTLSPDFRQGLLTL